MKVGVVTTSYPRFPDDPAGNFVGEHVRALRSRGHEVEVIAAGDVREERSVIRVRSKLFYEGGAPDLLERAPMKLASAAMFSTRLAIAIARRAHRWDSIVAHWLVPSALACTIAAPRTPLLAIAHGGDIHTLRRLRLLAPVLHLLHARDAQIVFVSEELRAIAFAAAPRLERWLADARIQPMGIDVARFASINRVLAPPTIVFASRLVPIKGVDVAIAAMKRVKHRARLVIAGDGPTREALQRAARPIESVVFLGELDTRARDRLLGEASVVVVPSRVVDGRSEGTPLIALEALAAGIPVIASAVGGLRSLRGVDLVPPDDPEALARAIDRVLDAPPDSEMLRESVAHLDWRRVVDTLVRST